MSTKRKWETTQRHWEDQEFLLRRATALVRMKWARLDRVVAKCLRGLQTEKGTPPEVLDVGCGRAELLGLIRGGISRYVGVDVSKAMLPPKKDQRSSVCFLQAEAEKLPKSLKNFDAVVFKESLDHCYDAHRALLNARRALKKGGKIIVTLNNRSSYFKALFPAMARRRQEAQSDHFFFYDIPSLRIEL